MLQWQFSLLRKQNFIPSTRCITFSWFEFVHHGAGTLFLQHTFICINLLRVLQFAYNPCDMLHVRTHERACPCSMSPELGVCLPYKDFLDITQFHPVILLVAIYVTRLDKIMCG